jgi:predicted DNA-binding transcriptional regulator AlpA
MSARSIPDWPRMLRRSTAALYLDMTAAEFEREISGGRLPMPVLFGGAERWSRAQLDEHIERLTGERVPDWRAGNRHYAR